jgi:hypothetical protein
MDTIVLQADLRESLEREAEHQQRALSDLVNEAVRAYLRQRDDEKIRQEQAAYERMHPSLVKTHFGKWVAVHEGQLVDSDADDVALHRRVLVGYPDVAVLITRVESSPVREIWLRSPRSGRLRR